MGKRKCKGCGELGHGETSYKCKLNGTKKRKRKPRKNTTKYGPNAKIPTKRTKKQSEQAVQDAQVEQSKEAVQDEQAEQSAIVPFAPEMSLVETSSTSLTMETYVQPTDEPSRTTRRTPIKKRTIPKKLVPRKTKTS